MSQRHVWKTWHKVAISTCSGLFGLMVLVAVVAPDVESPPEQVPVTTTTAPPVTTTTTTTVYTPVPTYTEDVNLPNVDVDRPRSCSRKWWC